MTYGVLTMTERKAEKAFRRRKEDGFVAGRRRFKARPTVHAIPR
jgi:hypothetical protein